VNPCSDPTPWAAKITYTGDIMTFLPWTKFKFCLKNIVLIVTGKISRWNLNPELLISLRQKTKMYLDFVVRGIV
jgi:hypothetical protein